MLSRLFCNFTYCFLNKGLFLGEAAHCGHERSEISDRERMQEIEIAPVVSPAHVADTSGRASGTSRSEASSGAIKSIPSRAKKWRQGRRLRRRSRRTMPTSSRNTFTPPDRRRRFSSRPAGYKPGCPANLKPNPGVPVCSCSR